MTILSFFAMYVLMYSMVNILPNALSNSNEFYMAALMTTPMILIEILVMGRMYPNKQLNLLVAGVSVLALVLFFTLIRFQVGVGDKQFLASMIPHHASAILMCEKASLQDPQVKQLCTNILSGQQAEIDWMKLKLESLKR